MKMLLTAIALTIASPALAQTAEPADTHAGHSGQSASPQAQPSSNRHTHHDTGGMMMSPEAMKAHCEKMKAEGKMMDGCKMMHSDSQPAADPHAGHDMSPK